MFERYCKFSVASTHTFGQLSVMPLDQLSRAVDDVFAVVQHERSGAVGRPAPPPRVGA